jgi:glycosyltransferase involved in cell wall biosynthesis
MVSSQLGMLTELRMMRFRGNRKVLVIVPAFNEAANIRAVAEDLRCFDGDVLVVNDGSTDETADVAEQLGLACVSHPFNLGIGGAIQTGLKYAFENGYELAIQFDGDGQHRADQIESIVGPYRNGEADLVIGSRTLPGGYKMGISRWIGSRIFSCLIKLLSGKTIQDSTSGFRCYGRKAIHLFSHYYPDDYPEVESIITAARCGLTILEVPVLMRPRLSGPSSINRRRSAYYMLKVSLALIVDSMRVTPTLENADPWI